MIHFIDISIVSQKVAVYSFACLTLLLCFWIYKKIFDTVTVNCWFCNRDSKVLCKEQNSWICSFCQQYNGFDNSGDYNKVLPEMYDEKLNFRQLSTSSSNESLNKICQEVKLCDKCLGNQNLKYKQLSQFKPINENNFEIEVEIYRNKLDNLYSLCSRCQNASKRFIKMQDTILRGRLISHIKPNNNTSQMKNNYISVSQHCGFYRSFQNLIQVLIYFTMLLFIAFLTISYFPSSHFASITELCGIPKCYFDDVPFIFHAIAVIGGLLLSFGNYFFYQKSGVGYLLFWVCFLVSLALAINEQSIIISKFSIVKAICSYWPFDTITGSFASTSCSVILFVCFIDLLRVTAAFINKHYDITTKKIQKSFIKNHSSKTHAKLPQNSDDHLFSDESDNEVESMEIIDNESFPAVPSDLNGSLNALNLHDKAPCCNYNSSKTLSDNFACSALPSSLHTPPPSRSSSLLSLSSHHSHVAFPSTPINKFGSTMHYARLSNELPFQSYKASSVVEDKTNSPYVSSRSVITSCSAYHNKLNSQKLSLLKDFQDFKKPIISPAKLHFSGKSQADKQLLLGPSKKSYTKLNYMNAARDYDAEISANDSVSQVGDKIYSELSDNDEGVPCTPLNAGKHVNLNSSSPKSTISNITSITLKSVAKVENSRACRWVLVVCLFINLILVILLIQEVRQMREAEYLKSRTSL